MRKLTKACIALAAFAAFAALPAVASATNNPRLTSPTDTFVAAGSAITATNVGHLAITDGNTGVLSECTTASLSGNLNKNDHTGIEWTITGASFNGSTEIAPHGAECRASTGPFLMTMNVVNGLNYCLRSTPTMATDTFMIRGGSCGEPERELRFIQDVTTGFGTIQCVYGNTSPITGTYATHSKNAVLTMSHQRFERKVESSFFCGAEIFLDMSFALKSGANTVYIDDVT